MCDIQLTPLTNVLSLAPEFVFETLDLRGLGGPQPNL